MKKILFFVLISTVCILDAGAVSRTENTKSRAKTTPITNTEKSARSITSRNAVKTTVSQRNATPVTILRSRTGTTKTATRTPVSHTATSPSKTVSARAATENQVITETRTGTEYEQCKKAFFTCMDQFCELKNDSFRRCSCNDRVFEFQEISETYQQANERLVEFSENLDIVGMTYEQALAMKTASEGEDALTEDKSASKQLLQAIMNSIKGEDASVGGKYKDLNSVTISSDMSNAFGMNDSGQLIASYNGATLYKAVYPKCRDAVKEDCNNASLQRAINAYLMAIEQDCNSVEAALVAQQKTLKASAHQSSAMLDLARIENRRNHNSDDVATCVANVEAAIQSEEVCGNGYYKCLDNGHFIDVTTGKPLIGVADFYKLGKILTFKKDGTDIKDQKLSSIQNNLTFVKYFEDKTKKFAKDALDKCTENADFVWQQYLDMALLDIYYAQQSKVEEIKQSCLDLVAQCYDNQGTAIANAMANLTDDSSLLLKPEALSLTKNMCDDYIQSCNSMFDDNIIQDYIAIKTDTDTTNACRGIVQQCFSKFGGTNYGNFYSKQNGLFAKGEALDWFSLYKKNDNGFVLDANNNKTIVSPCAQQIADIEECKDKVEEIFGGFDKYGTLYSSSGSNDTTRKIRPTGVATEVYYEILGTLNDRCNSLGGKFVKYEQAEQYGYKADDLCKIDSDNEDGVFYIDSSTNGKKSLVYWYHFVPEENMCPSGYDVEVDTQSWGICSCWENGGYRSKNGTVPTCRPIIPATNGTSTTEDPICSADTLCKEDETTPELCAQPRSNTSGYWCQQTVVSSQGQLCPTTYLDTESLCAYETKDSEEKPVFKSIDVVKEKVPARNR